MSRSFKKSPVTSVAVCNYGEKWDKQHANRKLRRRVILALVRESEVLPQLREVSDRWVFMKDGKHWYSPKEQAKLGRDWLAKMIRK